MTTIIHSPQPQSTPFAIYEDSDHVAEALQAHQTDQYDPDTSFSSEISLPHPDEPIRSIENDLDFEIEPDFEVAPDIEIEPYKSSYTSRRPSNRRISALTNASLISSLPSELSISSKPNGHAAVAEAEARYTPRKERLPFRNPSSVRAMQMSSPPPFNAFESPRDRLKTPHRLGTPSRSGTPSSVSRSESRSSHRHSKMQSPRPTPVQVTPQPQPPAPLVLLHVTILPWQTPYPPHLRKKVMPPWLLSNYKLLEEKLTDVILMQRGMLVSHPREEYDLLEERLLESLELKTPRILKDGHFVGPGLEYDEQEAEFEHETAVNVTEEGNGRGSRMSGGTITANDDEEWKVPGSPEQDDTCICQDCHRQIASPRKGAGSGTRRWDIKIYAANGLMRAGAWSAAWSEMERVDVEISPWIPDDIRRALEKAKEEEEREAAMAMVKKAEEEEERKRVEEEIARRIAVEVEEKRRADEDEAKRRLEEQARLEVEVTTERLCLEEPSVKEEPRSIIEDWPIPDVPNPYHSRSHSRNESTSDSQRDQIPLPTLLKNYIYLLARDQRNIVIVFLSICVLFLALNMQPASQRTSSIANILPEDLGVHQAAITTSTIVHTSTATATSTSVMITQIAGHGGASAVTASESPQTSDDIHSSAEASLEETSEPSSSSISAPSPSENEDVGPVGTEASETHAEEPYQASSESASVSPEELVSEAQPSEISGVERQADGLVAVDDEIPDEERGIGGI